ncbi:hypothetical protein T439DRAFT_328164 [Meredithblackwellia eburnea MCA 4105]
MSRQPISTGTKPWDRDHIPINGPNDPPSRPKTNRSRSGSPSPFLGAIGLAQPSLHVSLVEELLYLHPSPEGPSDDPLVSGTVTLTLPKAKAVRHLTVRLLGKQDIGWPDGTPYESGHILDKVVSLVESDQDVLLAKGTHTFTFSIIVPSQSATYERCRYGRVRHSVIAKAKGIGSMGGDVVSNERVLFLIVNPGGAGASAPPPPLHHKIEGVVDEIGPYTAALQSQHTMVGGLLLLRFSLVSPPTDIHIYSVKVKINQIFTLHSTINPKHKLQCPPDPRIIINIDGSHPANFGHIDQPPSRPGSPHLGPMKVVTQGNSFCISHLARLPNDNHLRPTTQPGTVTGISVSHEIAIEMTYRIPKPEDGNGKSSKEALEREKKKMTVTKPFDVFSCCCFLDSLTLPVYSILDPNPSVEAESWSPPCICMMKIEELIKQHGDTLLREEGEQGITYAPIQKSGTATPVIRSPLDRGRSGNGGREVLARNNSSDGYFDA